MPITDSEKVDFLLKKVGYEVAKTNKGILKTPDNETISSPITINSNNLWLDSIVANPDNSTVVQKTFVQLASDTTVARINQVNGTGGQYPTWLASSGDWISTGYGPLYAVRVFVADPGIATVENLISGGGVQIPAGGAGSPNDNGYFIDYAAGVIHFGDTDVPDSLKVDGKVVYLEGYRYIGEKGSVGIARQNANLQQFTNTPASGLRSIIDGTTGSGALVFQSSPTFNNGVTISGDLTVTGSGVSFSQASLVLTSLTAFSGNFTNALTLSGIPVSVNGHQHTYTPGQGFIDIPNFCSGVADCVDTELLAGNGIQLSYSDSPSKSLTIALSGVAANLHALADSGIVVKKSDNTFVGRSLSSGNNINILNANGVADNPIISLIPNVTGLESLAVDNLKIDGNTISSTNPNGNIDFVLNGNGEVNLPKVDIDGGSIDGTTIGQITPASGAFTAVTVDDTKIDSNKIYLSNIERFGLSSSETVVNDTGVDYDFRVEGTSSTNLLLVDAGANKIGINKSSPAYTLDVSGSGYFSHDLIVGGNLTIQGASVIANVSTMEVEDPILTLGVASGNIITNDAYDRGLALKFVNRTAFMGYDSSDNEFVLLGSGVTADGGNTYTAGTYGDLHIKDLDASNIDGTVIAASTKFSGLGTDLTGSGVNFTAGKANNLSAGATGSIPYQNGANGTTFLSIGTSGQFLRVNDGVNAPYWDTVDYAEIGNLPTIGDATLTFSVSGSGLTIGTDTGFTANSTTNKTFSVSSNATPITGSGTIVSRDDIGSFSANIITASLQGNATTATKATNADHIEVDSLTFGTHQLVFVSGINGNLKPLVNVNLRFDAANNILLGDDGTTPTTKIQYFIIDGGTP